MTVTRAQVAALPKAELHLHIEGTLEPELALELSARNRVPLAYQDVAALRRAYDFSDLGSFLALYYECMAVLRTAEDFADLAAAYLARAPADGVTRVEMFFDPQVHLSRGVPLSEVIGGLREAADRSAESRRPRGRADRLLPARPRPRRSRRDPGRAGRPRRPVARGRARLGRGRLPARRLRRRLRGRPRARTARRRPRGGGRAAGVRLAGDRPARRGPRRPRHPQRRGPGAAAAAGGRRHRADRVPAVQRPAPLRPRDRRPPAAARCSTPGVKVTVNSDDPAYFGGYIGDNYLALASGLGLGLSDLAALAANSMDACLDQLA